MTSTATDCQPRTAAARAKKTRTTTGSASGTARSTGLQEARRLKRALRELSDTVLLFLHSMDSEIGPDKTIPRDVSTKLGRACTFLDMQNDRARRFSLNLPITAAAKQRAASELQNLVRSNASLSRPQGLHDL